MGENVATALTAEQAQACQWITKWARDFPVPALTLGGYAGTGKTFLISHLAELLPELAIVFCAPTGKAAHNLRDKMPGTDVHTIHSLYYRAYPWHLCGCGRCGTGGKGQLVPEDSCPDPVTNSRGTPRTTHTYLPEAAWQRRAMPWPGLIVADEASMITKQVWGDMMAAGVPVLAVGDHGQLPPVKSAFNLMARPHLRLEQVHRQAQGDPIVTMATWARTAGRIPAGEYGPLARRVPLTHAQARGWAGWESGTLMITARRRSRMALNAATRAAAVSDPGSLLEPGEPVICLKNDRQLGVFNGQMFDVADVLQLDGSPVIDFCDTGGNWYPAAARQFGDDELLEFREKPRGTGLFDYAYAVTCHKAQGSEAARVIVREEDWPFRADERRRWLYTACTRARAELTVVF